MTEMPSMRRARIRTETLTRLRNRAFCSFLRCERCLRCAVFFVTRPRAPALALDAVTHLSFFDVAHANLGLMQRLTSARQNVLATRLT